MRGSALVAILLVAAAAHGCNAVFGIHEISPSPDDASTDARSDSATCEPSALGCNGQQPQTCNSAGAWTNVGDPCMHQTCVGGTCKGFCGPGDTQCDHANLQTCDSMGNWTDTTCPGGKVCNGGSCAAGCFTGAYQATNTADPTNACLSCQPGKSTTSWTPVADGTLCGAVPEAGAVGSACCSGACIDVSSDPGNCGGCGQACNAGPSPVCSDGRCIYTLFSGPPGLQSIAVDSTSVYWTNHIYGSVMKVSLDGSNPTTLSSQMGAEGIAVDATSVYWTNDAFNTVMKSSLSGTGVATLASGQLSPHAIAVDATSAYWTDEGNVSVSNTGSVVSEPLMGGGPNTLASGQNRPLAIAVDATSVYWLTWASPGNVMKASLAGSNPTTLASVMGGGPTSIAIDATSVYWTDSIGLDVMKVSLAGTGLTTLASNQDTPGGIAVDATSVYWTNEGPSSTGGSVMKASLAGTGAITLATGQSSPDAIAVDATSVYWLNNGGTVMKAPKK